MRSRLRKKRRKDLHRRQFSFIVGWMLTLDKKLRDELLASMPGTPFLITSDMAIAERYSELVEDEQATATTPSRPMHATRLTMRELWVPAV